MKIYLAIPYTGKEDQSFKLANKIAGILMQQGHIVFSPISHSHPINQECELNEDWEFWKKQDTTFIEWCDELHVVLFGDYKKSVGVMYEIEQAEALKKPVNFIQPKHHRIY